MITLVEKKTIAKYLGLSTDDKPLQVSDAVGMPNGSQFLEMDTGKKYYWNGDSLEWIEMPASGGGGDSGGGGGDDSGGSCNILPVNIIPDFEYVGGTRVYLDKTWNEINNAFQDGIIPFGMFYIGMDGPTYMAQTLGISADYDSGTYYINAVPFEQDAPCGEYHFSTDDPDGILENITGSED